MARSLHTPAYKRFRTFLIKMREERALTQLEVAKRVGKPQSYVAKYERGERRLDIIELLDICGALEIEPENVIKYTKEDMYNENP